MKHILLIAVALLCTCMPALAGTYILIQTDHTQLVLTTDDAGNLRTRYYGSRIDAPWQFLNKDSRFQGPNGSGPMTLPTTGGTFVGTPALHVRYADGSHNTELYYTGHTSEYRTGIFTTKVMLRDPVTDLAAVLIYEAYEKEDVIVTHTEIILAAAAVPRCIGIAHKL